MADADTGAGADPPADLDPDDLSCAERDAVEALLFRLADDELVLGERYTEWQVRAPTLESDLALANVAQDEFGHARLWYDLLSEFGYTEADLLFERDPADFRHATLVELPFESGDWADAVVRGYLYDEAERLRLDAVEASSDPRIRGRIEKVRREESYHREYAQNWLERLTGSEGGRERVRSAVDRLFPYAQTLFAAGPDEEAIVATGVRTESLPALRAQWLDVTVSFLESLGVDVPDPEAVERPDHVGRDGSHTDHWAGLHDEMTRAYRDLGRTETRALVEASDDVE
ncbi:MAG: 1,2-phenylacetyl-CoA epoxidase subunit PaaC [Haloferacaceae archaeon]